ncbi:MAG TPA: hypothetical protein VEV82_00195 [Actinomycetota bacterium]|nr:hypothetical protein [Actinomycetota bacterium]
MLATARRHLSAILIVLALGVVSFTAPAIAHGVQHALFAHDAGKVDGLDARTLRGAFAAGGNKAANENAFSDSAISFGFTLDTAPTPHYISSGDTPPPQCPGTHQMPKARPGHLCVYEENTYGVFSIARICFESSCPNASRFGASVAVEGAFAGAGAYGARGSWAVTIPN